LIFRKLHIPNKPSFSGPKSQVLCTIELRRRRCTIRSPATISGMHPAYHGNSASERT
jgi:hypothetical protein